LIDNTPTDNKKEEMTGMCFWFGNQIVARHGKVLFDVEAVDCGKARIEIASIGTAVIDSWVKFLGEYHIRLKPVDAAPKVA